MSKAQEKTQRMRAALAYREADRVPVGEAFWTGFLLRCKEKWGQDFDAYRHFDLDYVIVCPNMDPRIQPFEIISQQGDDIILKTGFGATIRRSGVLPMPHFDAFSVKQPEEMADFAFDAADDMRRFLQGGDDQLNCVGDALNRNIPSWEERLLPYLDDFAVFGATCEPYEYLWRIIGSENALVWMASEPDLFAAFVDRVGEWLLKLTRAEIQAAKGRLAGMYIYGDVAYRRGMLFNPKRWRELFKPHVKALIDECHKNNLMVVYHGCGNARAIFGDLAEIGLDAYNPLEAKADLDVVSLKPEYTGRLAFVGNVDVRVLERGDPREIRSEVIYKLQAAKGGGWVFQSDHSISSSVSPESYELAISILRKFGNYPLAI
jgi:uroporphyrinogen decarboxylase